ncbi:hypothetical protein T10_670, partial [Trichinella papuae]
GIFKVELSQITRLENALSVPKVELDPCEQACSLQAMRSEESKATGQGTVSAHTSYSECMNRCLAQRVRVQESSESSEE